MNILVFGLGALGTVYSCLLKNAGHRVIGFARESVLGVLQGDGVRVTGIWGDYKTPLDEFVSNIEQIKNKEIDLILVTVKSFDTEEICQQISPLVSKNTYVILIQNGYGNFEAAAKYILPDQLILARAIFGSETLGPGLAKVTVIADDVVIGSPANSVKANILDNLARVCSDAGIPTRASNQIMKYVWGKIIYNSALNSLGAVFEVNYGKLAETKQSKVLMDKIIQEIFAVLDQMRQETLWPNADAYLEDFYTKLVPSTQAHHASMLQDIRRGRRTEINVLNGAIVELGKKYNVATPVNEVITNLVKAKELMAMEKRAITTAAK